MIRIILSFVLSLHIITLSPYGFCGNKPKEEWSKEKLALAMLYADEIGSSAVIVLHKGALVQEWGDTGLKIRTASVRKSLLSALYGAGIDRGLIDITLTLEQLDIDDRPPVLTQAEKQATVEQLLKARSGVYHVSSAETDKMKAMRPKRGSFKPDEHWYYNNWDFNVLGTIFERQTNIPLDQAFTEWIAKPLGMQDFIKDDIQLLWTDQSLHPYSVFWMTARDLARFGQLFLQKGLWQGKQLLSEDWVTTSTFAHSTIQNGGYGYMWWIRPDGSYYAAGYHGQYVLILPKEEVVIVNMVFSGTPGFDCMPDEIVKELRPFLNPVSHREFIDLVEKILAAGPEHIRW
ncbi:MAG: class C beta-lactamase-related serine hydrolase [Desulfobulbaceae bacterium]|nr:MAG: class C beta-lactamase-related serine hydrolase [Desulfobulbaceae bacterium]